MRSYGSILGETISRRVSRPAAAAAGRPARHGGAGRKVVQSKAAVHREENVHGAVDSGHVWLGLRNFFHKKTNVCMEN